MYLCKDFNAISLLLLATISRERGYYYHHFTAKITEAKEAN